MVKNSIGSMGCNQNGDSGIRKTEAGNITSSHVAWPAIRWELASSTPARSCQRDASQDAGREVGSTVWRKPLKSIGSPTSREPCLKSLWVSRAAGNARAEEQVSCVAPPSAVLSPPAPRPSCCHQHPPPLGVIILLRDCSQHLVSAACPAV